MYLNEDTIHSLGFCIVLFPIPTASHSLCFYFYCCSSLTRLVCTAFWFLSTLHLKWLEETTYKYKRSSVENINNINNSHIEKIQDFHALGKEMATHSSVLAWKIPGMGEPGGLPSMGSHRVGHDWSDLAAATAAVIQWIRIWLPMQGALVSSSVWEDPTSQGVTRPVCLHCSEHVL